jgi:adenylate cyclase
VGDCINFASKLQEAARNLDVDLIIGPGTRKRASRTHLIDLGTIAVRGSDSPITVSTVAIDFTD